MDDGLGEHKASARIDRTDGLDAGNGGTHELALDLVVTAVRMRKDYFARCGPGEERNLVNRCVNWDPLGVLANDARYRSGKLPEAVDEFV